MVAEDAQARSLATKAAGEIFTKANIELPDASGYRYDTEIAASIIQQAIIEAVDAAVALERAKYARKVTEWRMKARNAVPIEYAIRAMNYKYLKGDNSAAGWDDCADELESLVKQP